MTSGSTGSDAGDGWACGRTLSAEDFAAAAAGRRPLLRERSLRLIRERDLPADWVTTTRPAAASSGAMATETDRRNPVVRAGMWMSIP